MAAAMAAATGCGGTDPATGIVLEIATDLDVPAEMDRLRIAITVAGRLASDQTLDLGSGPGRHALPLRMGIRPSGAGSAPIAIDVTGALGATAIVTRRAVVTFVDGQILLLHLDLLRGCAGRTCPAGQTCGSGGACVDPTIDPSKLPKYEPRPPDGGSPDGPPGPPDAVCEAGDPRPICMNTPDDPITMIIVTPDNVLKEIDLDAQVAYTICYRARAAHKSGKSADVTDAALWTLDRPEMGTFSAACVTTSTSIRAGGIVQVQAHVGSATGSASLILKLRCSREFDGVAAAEFGGPPATSPGAKPRVVYPLDKSMHPRNLASMNLQFFAGAGNLRFRARLTSSQLDCTFYFRPTRCDGDRCQWQVPEDVWSLVSLTNGGATATLVVSGIASGAGPVAQADPITLSFSPDGVIGGLYYFSTSLPGVLRIPWAGSGVSKKPSPFVIPNSKSNPKDCVGCHAITQDGSKMAATYGHGDDFLGIASGSDADAFSMNPTTTRSNFQTFDPAGTRLLSNFNGEMILRDGNTGAEMGRVARPSIGPDGKQRAIHPQWSHDGGRIVFTRLLPSSGLFYDVATCCGKREGGDWLATDAGDIVTMAWDGTGFDGAKVMVPAASPDFHYYPTWSPDDQWILFNSGKKPGFSPIAQDASAGFSYGVPKDLLVSYDQTTSRLRLVKSTGGGPIELASATVSIGLTASEPRFAPFQQKGGKLLFFTFSSKMDYGFVVTNKPAGIAQIWMAAVDTGKIGEGSGDPSFAPIWLPFQDERESSHATVWTTKIACEKDTKCGSGEFCSGGQCLPKIP